MGAKHILWYYRMSLWTIDSIRKEPLVKDLQSKYSRRMLGKHKFLQVSGSIGRTKKRSIKWERVTLYWSARSWHDWEGSITWRIVISSLISWKQMILQETWNFGRMHEIEYCRNLSEPNSFTNTTNSTNRAALKPSTSQTLQKPPTWLEITFSQEVI